MLEMKAVRMELPSGANIIVGQSRSTNFPEAGGQDIRGAVQYRRKWPWAASAWAVR